MSHPGRRHEGIGRAVTPGAGPGSDRGQRTFFDAVAPAHCREGRRSSAPTKEVLDDDSRSRAHHADA